jgi:hypothetical protein
MDSIGRACGVGSRAARVGTVLLLTFALLVLDHVLVPADVLALMVSPRSLTFSATQGGANPATQVVTLDKKGERLKTWTITTSAPWLVVNPTSGTISTEVDQIMVGANISGLVAGSHRASVTITVVGPKGRVGKSALPVTLTVTASAPTLPPAIGLSPTSLSFTGTAGGSNPAAQSVSIANTGGGTLSWTAGDNAAWLSLSPTSGTNAGNAMASVNLPGLAAGTYNATITVTATGATTKTLPVTLTVTPAATLPPAIGLSPTSLSFTGTAGGSNPAAKSVSIANTGGGTLSWTAGDNAAWLSLSPTSGTNAGTVTASVNLAGLTVGTYNATITVAAAGATTKTLPLTLVVNPTVTSSSAMLTWNANSESDLAGYKIYRATATGAYGVPLAIVPTGTSGYVANGLQIGTTYFFVITAYDNSGNESAFSSEVSKSIY